MSQGLNRVMLLGYLGADPELRFYGDDRSVLLSFRIATTESYFDRKKSERSERTDWHKVVLFGKRAEALQRILTKGSMVLVEGRLQTSSYERDGQKLWSTSIVAANIVLCGSRDRGERTAAPTPAPTDSSREASYPYDDEDIPF